MGFTPRDRKIWMIFNNKISSAVWLYLTGNIVVELEARYSVEGRLLNLLTTHQHVRSVYQVVVLSVQLFSM